MKTRTLRIITYFLLTLITLMLWGSILAQSHTRALGAPTLPGPSRIGKTGFEHRGTSFESKKSFGHYAISHIGINAKLFPGLRITRLNQTKFGIHTSAARAFNIIYIIRLQPAKEHLAMSYPHIHKVIHILSSGIRLDSRSFLSLGYNRVRNYLTTWVKLPRSGKHSFLFVFSLNKCFDNILT